MGGQASIEHQERDFTLLRDLYVSRIMTLAHAAMLHFDGRSEAAKKRIQKLKAAGLIAERPRKAREPGILHLSRSGFALLNEHGHLADLPRLSLAAFERRSRVSDLTIRHELAVMDTKAAFAPAISRVPGMTVSEFTTWPMLCEFTAQPQGSSPTKVKPDGRIRVEEQGEGGAVFEHTFYLEIDRGTETLATLIKRALCYREFYARGGFAALCGGAREDFASYPFRVLVVLPGAARRDNLAEELRTLNPPIRTQLWLTTHYELLHAPLGPIWTRPMDLAGERHRLFDSPL